MTMPKMELAEVSAAKDVVMDALSDHLDDGAHDLIGLAEAVVEALLRHDVLIPEWMPQIFLGGHPAQGYTPTNETVEVWRGFKGSIDPTR